MTHLEDLPAFRVDSIETGIDAARLYGQFNQLAGVHEGRSWLYAGLDSLIGDLENLQVSSSTAVFVAPFWSPDARVQVGTVAPWVPGYRQAYHVAMILDPAARWRREQFVPSDAQHYVVGTVHGWTKVGARLDADAIPTFVESRGWDHEECELCYTHVGRGGLPHGYVDIQGRWLCETCYRKYAQPRDLSFLLAT